MVQEHESVATLPADGGNGGKISGYYIEEVKISLGTGATKRKTTGENIFLAEELPSGEVKLSLLNMAGKPIFCNSASDKAPAREIIRSEAL